VGSAWLASRYGLPLPDGPLEAKPLSTLARGSARLTRAVIPILAPVASPYFLSRLARKSRIVAPISPA
jgi:hypothetical protein